MVTRGGDTVVFNEPTEPVDPPVDPAAGRFTAFVAPRVVGMMDRVTRADVVVVVLETRGNLCGLVEGCFTTPPVDRVSAICRNGLLDPPASPIDLENTGASLSVSSLATAVAMSSACNTRVALQI